MIVDRHATSVVRACNCHIQAIRHIRYLLKTELALTLVCSLILSRRTTATLCCTELQPAVFRSCSTCRTLQRVSFCRAPGDRHLSHYSSSCIGFQSDNGSTTNWPSCRIRSTTVPPRSTSAVTPSLAPSLVGFALLQRHESANRLPGPTSPTVLFRCSAPAVWNSLTADIVDSSSLPILKHKLKTCLFRHAFSSS